MQGAQQESTRLPFWVEKLAIMAVMLAFFAYGFLAIDDYNDRLSPATARLALATPFDDRIPFVPVFVYVYALYALWLVLPAAMLRRRQDFYAALKAFLLIELIAGLTFILLPSHIVRPMLAPVGPGEALLHWIYRVDEGWNVFPSLHVAHSVLVALLARTHARRFFVPVAIGSALISVSTVLIKQHYLLDIPAGALLAWLSYRAIGLHRATAPQAAPCRNAR